MSLICSSCGRKVETLPLQCGYSITMNTETNQMECNMGLCGVITFDQFLCENCCINNSIMKILHNYENLSLENQEFHEELNELEQNIVQTKLIKPDLKYWVEFGNGVFKYGKGENNKANIHISCPQKIMTKILMGNSPSLSEILRDDVSIDGNLQYAVVYFDLLNLALEIINEKGSLYNE
ncbi:MAG: SCP2 sterol-binding domain-containing protein [Promethearchaeota archaeon]